MTWVNLLFTALRGNLLIYLIIFLALAMVLAPLMAFRPTKLVKRQTAFREKAIGLGLQVKIADLPQSHRAKVRQQDPEQGVIYRLPFVTDKPLENPELQCCIQVEQSFEWVGKQPPLDRDLFEQALADLGDDSVALELSSTGVGLYWREQGEPERVQQVYESLLKLRSAVLDRIGVK